MKNFLSIILLIITVLFFSCKSGNDNFQGNHDNTSKSKNQNEDEYYLDDYLQESYNSITFFDEECLNNFEKYFKQSEVWKDTYTLVEGCYFLPKKSKFQEIEQSFDNLNFYSFVVKKDSIYDVEMYCDGLSFDALLIPFYINQEDFYLINSFKVVLYVGDGFNCGDIRIEGLSEKNKSQRGVWEEIKDTSLLNYADSIIETRGISK
ncbi:MAG: hypothetical protein ACQERC_00130 [Bacteroidota bacterium]